MKPEEKTVPMTEEESVIAIEIAETAKFAAAKSELVPAAKSVSASAKETRPDSWRASHTRPHSRVALQCLRGMSGSGRMLRPSSKPDDRSPIS